VRKSRTSSWPRRRSRMLAHRRTGNGSGCGRSPHGRVLRPGDAVAPVRGRASGCRDRHRRRRPGRHPRASHAATAGSWCRSTARDYRRGIPLEGMPEPGRSPTSRGAGRIVVPRGRARISAFPREGGRPSVASSRPRSCRAFRRCAHHQRRARRVFVAGTDPPMARPLASSFSTSA
jgi:hypothetical protein